MTISLPVPCMPPCYALVGLASVGSVCFTSSADYAMKMEWIVVLGRGGDSRWILGWMAVGVVVTISEEECRFVQIHTLSLMRGYYLQACVSLGAEPAERRRR
ncbi:hypothetical protein WG66_009604 [Moniliophthora roreri]|nr:hypothetical protein WG66_009604 [Moniliophthora roreri]